MLDHKTQPHCSVKSATQRLHIQPTDNSHIPPKRESDSQQIDTSTSKFKERLSDHVRPDEVYHTVIQRGEMLQ